MIISLIAAMDKNRVVGKDNQLPWHLSQDLKHFKAVTMGKPVIMGRKTFESIGRPLPGRRNVIVTRNGDFKVQEATVVHTLQQALAAVKGEIEVMIIGGGEIFRQAMPFAQKMYLTLIDHVFEGDAFFPEWSAEEWEIVKQEKYRAEGSEPYSYQFIDLVRIK